MGISGSTLAPLYALSAVARAGATRAGYHSSKLFVSIAGTHYATGLSDPTKFIDEGSLSVDEALNQNPNRASMTARGFDPAEGQDVVVTLGSKNNYDRQFAGSILIRSHHYVGSPANYNAPISVIDYTWGLTRRLFTGYYTTTDAKVIADAIIAYAPGYTSGVLTGLGTIDAISFTNVDLLSALSQLAKRLGGYVDVDYHKVVKLFLTDATVTNPTSLTSAHVSLTDFSVSYDLSQVRTRVWVEGGGANALLAAAVGATSLAVEDAGWYNTGGGTVVSGQQRITYTGLGLGYSSSNVGGWAAQTGPAAARDWSGLAWSPSLGLFVAVAGNSTPQDVMTSPDGVTWTTRAAAASKTWRDVIWAASISLFVAVSSDGFVMTSPDGVTWTSRTAAAANAWECLAWAPSIPLFVAVSATGANRVMTSPDGITWTSRTAAAALPWQSVTWSPELLLFCAVASTGPNAAMTSPDGITWTQRTTPIVGFTAIAWSAALSLFVATGAGGAVISSPEGTTWTQRTAASANAWQDVIWVPELSLFLAVASDGAGDTKNRIMASTDGVTWSSYPEPSVGLWYGVAFAPSLAKFAAVGIISGATIQIMTNSASLYSTLTGIPASGAGSILYAIKAGDPVNLLVQCDDSAAQTALAALIGGTDDGIVEEYLQDGRIGFTEATARGTAQLALVSTTQVSIAYKVRDKNTHAGRVITVSLGSPTSVSADFRIQHVTIDSFQPALMPTYTVQASSSRFSLEDLLRIMRLKATAT